MAIPEMGILKEKYPEYKDIPDEILLQKVARKYPEYQVLEKREFGELSAQKEPGTPLTPPQEQALTKNREINLAKEFPIDYNSGVSTSMEAFGEGVLPIRPRDQLRPGVKEAAPIAAAAGELTGLALTGAATAGVAPAVTKGLSSLPTIARIAAGKMAQSGATFGLKELSDNIAEVIGGEDLELGKRVKDTLGATAFGAGFGGVGTIPTPLLRIPAEAAYGFITSKIQGADNFEAGINAGLFGVFGMLNAKNLSSAYKLEAFNGAKQALVDRMIAKGIDPKKATSIAERYMNWAVTKGGGYAEAKIKDFDNFSKAMKKGWRVSVEPDINANTSKTYNPYTEQKNYDEWLFSRHALGEPETPAEKVPLHPAAEGQRAAMLANIDTEVGRLNRTYAITQKPNVIKQGYIPTADEQARINIAQAGQPRTGQPPQLTGPVNSRAPYVIDLDYKPEGVKDVVSNELPNEVITPAGEAKLEKVASRYYHLGPVTDQSSLEKVGAAIANGMGIEGDVKWIFKTSDSVGTSGLCTPHNAKFDASGNLTPIDTSKPISHTILIHIGKSDLKTFMHDTGTKYRITHERKEGFTPYSVSQGKIKKLIVHEANHIASPQYLEGRRRQMHSTIFLEDAKYHEANLLINRAIDRGRTPKPILAGTAAKEPPMLSTSKTDPKQMRTQDLEKFIDERYEAGASQEEIDKLEDEYATRVSEDELDMSEGISVEEQLTQMFHRYMRKDARQGMEPQDIINNMRDVIETAGGKRGLTDKQILEAAEDAYINKSLIINRHKQFQLNVHGAEKSIVDLDKVVSDIQGEGQKITSDVSHFAKRFGTPFFIGEKYQAFKPVYRAVQNALEYRAELFFTGAHILSPKDLARLPAASKEKLTQIIKLGNSPDVQKWYSADELKSMNCSPEEIVAYGKVGACYKFATDMEIKARKEMMDYNSLQPAQKVLADKMIADAVGRLGGYVSQSRTEGDWAVFAPPEKEGETARFFNLYKTKGEAEAAGKQVPGSTVYLRRNLGRDLYHKLSLADLERLVEAADLESNDATVIALRNELKKKTFSSHWIRRQNVPGYDWNFDNVIESAIDYLHGASNKVARVVGRAGAENAFRENIKGMTPELQAYSRDFIDGFYNSGSIGIQGLNKLLYVWKLAFKTSWLAQNLTQPIATTYPTLAAYYPGVGPEKVFLSSYNLATRYCAYRLKGAKHGLSSELVGLLNKLHKQGVLGDQLTKFQMGVRKLGQEEFEKWLGLYGRVGEAVNRSHAAICGYKVATEVKGLTDKDAIYAFVKEFVAKTQYVYGKQNLPLIITTGGGVKNFLRTLYSFRHYTFSYLQMLNSQMPWRGAKAGQYSRALGSLLTQAGIKGLPFMGLAMLGYKMWKEKVAKTGGTLESDLRIALKDYPPEFSDVLLHGGWSLTGADTSQLIGMGDAISTMGTAMDAIGGAPVGFAKQLGKAATFAAQGDTIRALEYASPDAIRSLIRAYRYTKEGLRTPQGEPIADPSGLDIGLTAVGFQPLSISKAYAKREAMTSIEKAKKDASSDANSKLARLLFDQDVEGYRKELLKITEHNKHVKNYSERIQISPDGIKGWVKKYRGISDAPKVLREKERGLNKVFEQRKAGQHAKGTLYQQTGRWHPASTKNSSGW